ncbi:NAD-dependent epimerase/dehydratase family protein [Streptomyces sp. So13.3]|uniref:SDR family oxidoreductase n=1 Tax=Streptomyces TaxID=1883 RepID=UPI001105A38B|nr:MULTISPECIES: SDR family oxidoreductase [Streptomyces]QNA71147.1 NAD-dependent epimerase/dehydratase family protein [Streptomyces sp. So13.3]
MRGTTVITGADGYLGRRLAAALLDDGDDDLILAVRAASAIELDSKWERLAEELGPDAAGRTRCVAADVRHDSLLSDVDPGVVTRIVHGAAVTRFNVERDIAADINVAGAVRLRAFAGRCENLQRFALLSTLYAAGSHQGDIAEERLPDAGFVNHYEWSKWAAEEQLLGAAGEMPVSVLRLPTVIADDDSGHVTQYNVFHNTLKLFHYGLLSLLPGDEKTPLSLATAAFTVSAVTRLLDPAVADGVYHVCPDPARTPTLGELVDLAFSVFERDSGFRRRGLIRPVPCDRESFDDLLHAATGLRAGPLHQSLASVSPFAAQLYLPKTFRNEALRAAWPAYAAPDPYALTEATCTRLVTSKWGRRPEETS